MPVVTLSPPREWPTLGKPVLDWIETYLCHGPGDVQGERIFLDDEFAQVIYDLYRLYPADHPRAGQRVVTYGCVSMPKGRAKSEFAGMLVCAELRGPVRFDGFDAQGLPVGRPVTYPMVRCLATEEGQTGNTYGNVVVMLEHARDKFGSEWGFDDLDIGSTRVLVGKGGKGGEVRPSSAGAASKDGGKESFAVADEPHLYVLPELRQMHAMVRRNSRKRKDAQPWMLATTTMFEPGQQSVAEELYDEAAKLLDRPRKHYGFYWHHREGTIAEADWDDDAAQVASLAEAYGPAAEWMDLESIVLDEIRAPGSVAAENMRYFHNRRWKGENKAVDPAKWDALADPSRTPTSGRILVAFDGSDRGIHADDTVLVGWTVSERPHLFFIDRWRKPATAGAEYRVPRGEVRARVAALFDGWDVVELAADPPYWREEIDTWGSTYGEERVVEFITNRPTEMGPAIDRFLEAVDNGSFTHDGSPELREYALNALLVKAKGRADQPAYDKPTVAHKIDGLVAATFGYAELAHLDLAPAIPAGYVSLNDLEFDDDDS